MKNLARFMAWLDECTVSRGCKWVAWPLVICYMLPVLMCSEALGVKPRFDTFLMLVGVAGYTG